MLYILIAFLVIGVRLCLILGVRGVHRPPWIHHWVCGCRGMRGWLISEEAPNLQGQLGNSYCRYIQYRYMQYLTNERL